MEINIITQLLIWSLVLVVFFWIMPDEKSKVITNRLTSLLQVLPISKICEVILEHFKTRRKKRNKKKNKQK